MGANREPGSEKKGACIMKAIGIGIFSAVVIAAGIISVTNGDMRNKKSLYENDQVIHTLLVLDRNTLENAKVLIHDLETKGVVHLKTAGFHSSEMLRSLNASEQYLGELENATDIALDEMQLRYLAGLHQHYLNAIAEQKELDRELAGVTPSREIIKMRALHIYAEMKKAEKEQLQMDSASGIKEPEAPETEK
jgi:hypothetical protein